MAANTLGTSADSITVQIVNAVADETGRDPNTLPPLYDVVSPDALQTLLTRPPSTSREADDVEVTFEFADCNVTASADGGIDVSPEIASPRTEAPMQTVDD